jgi:hypothetical protein
MRALPAPGEASIGKTDRSFLPTPKARCISSADTKTSLSFPPFLFELYHTTGFLSRAWASVLELSGRAHIGNPIGLGKIHPIGEARTFCGKNRIWCTRPENRPWRPSAAGQSTDPGVPKIISQHTRTGVPFFEYKKIAPVRGDY